MDNIEIEIYEHKIIILVVDHYNPLGIARLLE